MYQDIFGKYLDDLASKKPAPGGGSAAALIGATGAALLSKVANFTVGKEKYKSVEKEMRGILERSEALRGKFNKLCAEDVDAYKKLSDAFKLPKDDGARKEKVQNALKEASHVPLEVCKTAHEGMKLCLFVSQKGNINLITDTGIASLMFKCTFHSGLLNVEINLNGITDKEFINGIRKTLEPMEKEISRINDEVKKEVKKHL